VQRRRRDDVCGISSCSPPAAAKSRISTTSATSTTETNTATAAAATTATTNNVVCRRLVRQGVQALPKRDELQASARARTPQLRDRFKDRRSRVIEQFEVLHATTSSTSTTTAVLPIQYHLAIAIVVLVEAPPHVGFVVETRQLTQPRSPSRAEPSQAEAPQAVGYQRVWMAAMLLLLLPLWRRRRRRHHGCDVECKPLRVVMRCQGH
jgi:MYXO-CTERM domain-containing protein